MLHVGQYQTGQVVSSNRTDLLDDYSPGVGTLTTLNRSSSASRFNEELLAPQMIRSTLPGPVHTILLRGLKIRCQLASRGLNMKEITDDIWFHQFQLLGLPHTNRNTNRKLSSRTAG